MRSSYKLTGLYHRQLSATSRLESSATSNASCCLRYWETQLGKTTLNSNGIIAAKKTVSSAFDSFRSEDFPCKTSSTHTQRASRSGVPKGVFYAFCHYDCSSSVAAVAFPLVLASAKLLVICLNVSVTVWQAISALHSCLLWQISGLNQCNNDQANIITRLLTTTVNNINNNNKSINTIFKTHCLVSYATNAIP